MEVWILKERSQAVWIVNESEALGSTQIHLRLSDASFL